jgi:hypothetical protein
MKFFLLTILMISHQWLLAQNLVSNGGFESYSSLPYGAAQYNLAIGWSNCNGNGSPDYFHVDGFGEAELPFCYVGTVYPHTGSAIMGFCPYYQEEFPGFREYVTSQLTSPLIAGNSYEVSFYITNGITAGTYGGQGIDQVSVAFSVGELTQPGFDFIPFVTATMDNTGNFI